MKKTMLVLMTAAVFAACNSSSPRGDQSTDSTQVGVDSANVVPPSTDSVEVNENAANKNGDKSHIPVK